jgi:hypothetical protein
VIMALTIPQKQAVIDAVSVSLETEIYRTRVIEGLTAAFVNGENLAEARANLLNVSIIVAHSNATVGT